MEIRSAGLWLSGIIILLSVIYRYLTSRFDLWKKLGISGPKPIALYGNLKSPSWGLKDTNSFLVETYNKYKNEPLVGVFLLKRPALILRDPDIISDILIKNFNSWMDRGFKIVEEVDPLWPNLIFIEHQRWRVLRTKMTGGFTSGKIKDMFHLLSECGDNLVNYINELIKSEGDAVDVGNLTKKFTTDAVGMCAFGLNLNTINEKDSDFQKYLRLPLLPIFYNKLKRLMTDLFPTLYKLMKPLFYEKDMNEYFTGLIRHTRRQREESGEFNKRHDFIDILMELKKNTDDTDSVVDMTDMFFATQAMGFFFAGFETSATTMSHTLLELALNPKIQEKVRVEIREERVKNEGKLDYDTVKNMKYLDQVFKETLRKYPPVKYFTRQSLSEWKIPGKDTILPSGTKVYIPAYAIHHDEKVWPDPEIFDPERFTPEMENARHPMNYLAFGNGPRRCVGERFANFETKVGIIRVIENFEVEISEKMKLPYEIETNCLTLFPVGGVHLKIKKLKKE